MKIYDYFLASDELEGHQLSFARLRYGGVVRGEPPGRVGIEAWRSTTGLAQPAQPYFMPIELVTRAIVPEDSKASLTAPGAGRGDGVVAAVESGTQGARGGSRSRRHD